MHGIYRTISCVLIAAVATSLIEATPAHCQQADEKLLTKQSLKKVQKSVEKIAAEGYVPMDAMVNCNGRRAMFDVRLTKPVQEIAWYSHFEMSDLEFEKLNAEKRAEGFQVAWHDQFEIRKRTMHACIWHSDGSFVPLTNAELFNPDEKPQPHPVGKIWGTETRIPVASEGHEAFAKFEQQSIDYLRANQMPALSAAVAVNGKVMYEGSFGYSDLETRLPIKAGQPIRTSSLSQLITVVAALQLVERGKLRLDQPVYELLAVDPWKPNSVDARSKNITVLHLLQETGGYDHKAVIEPGFQPRYLAAVFKKKGQMVTRDEVISFMMSQPLAKNPGDKRSVSSYGYFLLARVIEKVTGSSYEDFVLKKIARPLKLKSLRMSRTDPDKRSRNEVENVYRPGNWYPKLAGTDVGKWVQINRGGYQFELLDGSHGWLASAGDMIRLGLAIQANPSPILSSKSKTVLTSKPDCLLAIEKQEGKPRILWKGCSIYCQKTSKGITMSMNGRGASGSAAIVCHSTRDVAFCYVFNCANTVSGSDTKTGYDPVIRGEAYRVHDSLNRK